MLVGLSRQTGHSRTQLPRPLLQLLQLQPLELLSRSSWCPAAAADSPTAAAAAAADDDDDDDEDDDEEDPGSSDSAASACSISSVSSWTSSWNTC